MSSSKLERYDLVTLADLKPGDRYKHRECSPHNHRGAIYTKLTKEGFFSPLPLMLISRTQHVYEHNPGKLDRKVWFLRHATPEELERLASLPGVSTVDETTEK